MVRYPSTLLVSVYGLPRSGLWVKPHRGPCPEHEAGQASYAALKDPSTHALKVVLEDNAGSDR